MATEMEAASCLSVCAPPPYFSTPVLPLLDVVPSKKGQRAEVWVWQYKPVFPVLESWRRRIRSSK